MGLLEHIRRNGFLHQFLSPFWRHPDRGDLRTCSGCSLSVPRTAGWIQLSQMVPLQKPGRRKEDCSEWRTEGPIKKQKVKISLLHCSWINEMNPAYRWHNKAVMKDSIPCSEIFAMNFSRDAVPCFFREIKAWFPALLYCRLNRMNSAMQEEEKSCLGRVPGFFLLRLISVQNCVVTKECNTGLGGQADWWSFQRRAIAETWIVCYIVLIPAGNEWMKFIRSRESSLCRKSARIVQEKGCGCGLDFFFWKERGSVQKWKWNQIAENKERQAWKPEIHGNVPIAGKVRFWKRNPLWTAGRKQGKSYVVRPVPLLLKMLRSLLPPGNPVRTGPEIRRGLSGFSGRGWRGETGGIFYDGAGGMPFLQRLQIPGHDGFSNILYETWKRSGTDGGLPGFYPAAGFRIMKTVPLQPEKNLHGGCFEKYGML